MNQDNARPKTHDDCVALAEQVIGSHYEPYSVAEGQSEDLVDAIERALIERLQKKAGDLIVVRVDERMKGTKYETASGPLRVWLEPHKHL